jgi:hypothetical protein
MPHDPVRMADTRAWLEKARLDLGAGYADLSHDPPFCGDAMFHPQQAAEKALKGFLSIPGSSCFGSDSRPGRSTASVSTAGGFWVS